ncbi:hypothetical protein MH117_24570 [Paenibacillus sp. ACRRX]|uniref:hypothetical protein n=1 Tax=Paenibacillus sp. ACRRX TaxID=2918206 RepID=UPI001EF4EAD9|nr:hypothetical protein [Paenibacillus sp. ACRRX]MCG7410575.1 hypothetical protein [Paenibacillus sp. ACRRX]
MTKDNKKLTLADLVAAKLQKEQKRENNKMDHYVESLGGWITIALPDEEIIIKGADMLKDETLASVLESYSFLIYHSVALFRSPELHEQCDVLDPLDIVKKLLDVKERIKIGELIMGMSNMDKFEDNIKN